MMTSIVDFNIENSLIYNLITSSSSVVVVAEETCPYPIPVDPAKSPGADWEWRGKSPVGGEEGAWYNPGTGESLHPDTGHPEPVGPHWDYTDGKGKQWRVNPDGTMEPK